MAGKARTDGRIALNLYNEFDPFAADWLERLIAAGAIAPGRVDRRSITDLKPADLAGVVQAHFFAGIGGWSRALRIAGWPDDTPVWTGSPPCQPFSVAGKGLGKRDERHLAPVWLDLVRECKPPVIFGEQVAAAVTKDRWLDDLLDALEGAGYACGAAVMPACSVGAPHIRQRLWVAAVRMDYASGERLERHSWNGDDGSRWPEQDRPTSAPGSNCRVADVDGQKCSWRSETTGRDNGNWQNPGRAESDGCAARCGDDGRVENADRERLEREQVRLQPGGPLETGPETSRGSGAGRTGPLHGFWQAADWLFCRDGKWRPVKSGTFPLAHGVSARVGRLRGYGNAIVPQVAAEFVRIVMEWIAS